MTRNSAQHLSALTGKKQHFSILIKIRAPPNVIPTGEFCRGYPIIEVVSSVWSMKVLGNKNLFGYLEKINVFKKAGV